MALGMPKSIADRLRKEETLREKIEELRKEQG